MRADGATLVTIYGVALIAVPSRLTFAPLGGAGSPADIVGLGAFCAWAYFHIRRPRPTGFRAQPVRTAMFVLLFMFGVSYIAAMTRAIDPAESSTAQLGLVELVSWAGILFVANDGIPTRRRLDTVLRRLCLGGGLLGLLGIAQFVTGRPLIDIVPYPGLTASQAFAEVATRAGFNRPAGTAIHPIEFGAVLTMILPIAINLAIVDKTRSLLWRWGPVATMSVSVFISISRSAIICAAVGMIVLAVGWTRMVRWIALACTAFLVALLYVTIPGLVETLTQLFTGIGTDSSAESRVGSYSLAGEFISRSPLWGRGFATFLPKYRILDNQYLGLLIEVGVLGCLAVLALLVTAILCSRVVAVTATTASDRLVAQGLTASVCAAAVGLAFYDGLGFPMAAGMLFLILGLAGAQWRLTRRRPRPARGVRPTPSASRSRPGEPVSITQGISRTSTRALSREPASHEPVVGRRGENHVSA